MLPRSIIALTVVGLAASLAPAATAGDTGSWTKLKAKLFGDTAVQAKSVCRTRDRDGTVERRFKVQLEDAAANTAFDVWVAGYFVDTIVTNGNGFIEYQLRTPQFIDDPGDGLPMPADFPDLQSLDTAVVGGLSGVFFVRLRAPVRPLPGIHSVRGRLSRWRT